MVGHLSSTSNARIGSEGTSSFLYVAQGILVQRAIPRLESHSIFRSLRIIYQSNRCSGKMHNARNQATEPAGHLERAVYHSFRAGMDDPTSIPQPAQRKHQNHKFRSPMDVQSVRPTWFEDVAAPKDPTPQPNQDPQGQQPQPLHGLKLVIKEEVLPMKDQPEFPSLELLAARGLLAPDTWKCKRAQVSLKATIDVPMLGTIIEQNGDGLLEDSHMPVGNCSYQPAGPVDRRLGADTWRY